MENTTQGKHAPKFITARHAFERANAAGEMLFEVRPGVPVIDALNSASCYLSAANESVMQAADKRGIESIYGSAFLVRMAKAVVDSAIKAIEDNQGEATE